MNEVIKGDASLDEVLDGSTVEEVEISDGKAEEIRIDGDCSLSVSSDGDYSHDIVADGVSGIVYETGSKEYETYTGSYEITPKMVVQTLETASKIMSRDVKVKEIPVYETSNESGGTTVYIAMEE